MADEFLVLRFRDLSVEPGDTIRYHQKVIARLGSCWWGWWARAHECSLADLWVSGDLPRTLLYDTDRAMLYQADCVEYRSYKPPQLSPDSRMTPDYYNGRQLPGWFRLQNIILTTSDQVLGATVLKAGDPSVIVGWQVGSLQELRDTTATAWILAFGDRG